MQITFFKIMMGADPEFFFTKNGKVIGAEKIVPKDGVTGEYDHKDLIIDGVQAEFNVQPSYCRESFATYLRSCFRSVASVLPSDVKANFTQTTVAVTKKEMGTLAPASQQFGCAPSTNAYEKSEISVKDASTYLSRSAGGHIHLGVHHRGSEVLRNKDEHKAIVQLLDILVGNTCVLLDRDPGNVERRKVYGRAGEYRSPAHGLEYRTLSNFWLQSYPLMSFVLAMARFAVNVYSDGRAVQSFLDLVDMEDIKNAINDNDFDLAYSNFQKIKSLIASITSDEIDQSYPLQGARIERFETFVKQGIHHYFKEDVLKYWVDGNYMRHGGWEVFVDRAVPAGSLVIPEQPYPTDVQRMGRILATAGLH